MGKKKMKKRMPLQKQFALSYVKILIFSTLSTLIAILAFYYFYHNGTDMNSLTAKEMSKIIDYSAITGSSLKNKENLTELDRLVNKIGLTYYIKDLNNNILISNEAKPESSRKQSSIMKRFSAFRNNFAHTSSMNIPLIDKNAGKVDSILVIIYPGHLIIVDAMIPLACLVFFTLFFSRNFSRRIRKPLDELMGAVEKIKNRDLDFSITSSQDDEIGDLSSAFEDMRQNLKDSLIREWQLEQDRRDMINAVAHDLKTPLAIIQGHVEVLQSGLKKDSEKLDEYLSIIEQNSNRANRLIIEMNSLSEIDSPDFSQNKSEMDLEVYLKAKVNELRILADKKGINLIYEINDNRAVNKLVAADSVRLSQVIDNIVENSIRFTPYGGTVQITVNIEDDKANFRIIDSGKGFSQTDLNNLFKKFYKGDRSRGMEKGHSGLGLYISKSIIENSGGEIKASNSPSGGACLEFNINI